MSEQLTKKQILEETAAFYNSNNRAIEAGRCEYETEDGRCCAVGRCLNPEKVDRKNLFGSIGSIIEKKKYKDVKFEDISFLDKYAGHEASFWRDLQVLHDNPNYWDAKGLNVTGKKHFDKLMDKYAD